MRISRNRIDLEGGRIDNATLGSNALDGLTLAQGDILYFNGTNVANLGPGTDGQFLKTQGAGANPAWAAAGGGGGRIVGEIIPYAGTSTPSKWLFCFGQNVSRSTYSDLFTAVGTTYGVGDGSTTFGIPDLRGRVVAGRDDMGGTSANRLTNQAGGLDGDVLGDTGGSETHTLTESEMPAHTHRWAGSAYPGSISPVVDSDSNDGWSWRNTQSTGGDVAHNNIQPSIILNYIIYTGV